MVYRTLTGLISDLNATSLLDHSPNPLHGVLSVSSVLNKDTHTKMLCLEAPAATTDHLPGTSVDQTSVRGWEKARNYGAVEGAGFRHHGIGSGGTPSFGKPEARRDLTWSM